MRKVTENRNITNILWSLLPCAAVLFLAMIGGVTSSPFPDSVEYIGLSQGLAENFSFDSALTSTARRVPGYPFSILLFYGLGDYAFLAVNVLFIFGISWFGMKLMDRLKINHSWVLPVLIFLSPGLITLSSVPLSETAFIFFLTLCLYLFMSDKIFFAGLALSAATFCRPISIFLFLLFAAWLVFRKKKVILIVLFILAANIFPTFWITRNYIKYNYPVYTTLSNFYLLYYKAGSYLSWKNDIPFDEMRNQLSKQLEGENVFEQSASAGRFGKKILLENFWGFCLWAPRNMVNFLMPDITPLFERLHVISGNRGTLDVLRRKGLLAAFNHYFNNNIPAMVATFVYLVYYFLLFAAVIAGIVRLYLEKHYEKLIFGTLLIGYFWILPIGNLDWRFRMPVVPLFFILAIYGSSGYWKWHLSRTKESK